MPVEITIYDHHRKDQSDIPGATIIDSPYGAESSHLALLCRDAGATVGREEATMGLTGIFADTGNFTHEEVTAGDFEAAQWLMENGASRKLVRRFLRPLRQEGQADLFHRLEAAVTWRRFHGHEVALARLEIPSQIPGIAEVVDRAFAAEPVDAFFALVTIADRGHRMVIGRSRKEGLDILELLEPFGGRGHTSAASALIKEERNVWAELLERLDRVPKESMTAAGLMTREVDRLSPEMTVLEASLFFEKTGHTGAPVVDREGEVKGILTLRDVSQARKAEAMHAPVSAYMSRMMISWAPEDTIREVERKMLGKNVGHLPVLSGTRLVGLITRGDYKRFYA
jgi:tRNA nucleotidyltransferase (CCA-adding enzyme)